MPDFQLHRSPLGKLVYTDQDGNTFESVVPVRAFPISAPTEAIAIVTADGHELVWIEEFGELSEATRHLLLDELASREFMPQISRLHHVSSFATPSTWSVDTDRGPTTFVLKGEDDIRRLNSSTLLIADSNGIHFLIRDLHKLDATSRKLLDRFL